MRGGGDEGKEGGGVKVRIRALSVVAAMPDTALLTSKRTKAPRCTRASARVSALSHNATSAPHDNEREGAAPMLYTRHCLEYPLSPAENVWNHRRYT